MSTAHKRLTRHGGITIPQAQRHQMGLRPGMAMELEQRGGELIIRKAVPACHLCGSVERVATSGGLDLCHNCWLRLGEVFQDE